MLNLNQLRAFYEVARVQSIKEACKNLYVTEPAVSMMVKSFEDFCNLSLFKRVGRKLVLTDSGNILLQSCRRLFEMEKEIEVDIENLHQLKLGILKFGTSKTVARYLMPPYIDMFHSRYPDVKFILDEGSSLQIAQSIIKSQIELGLIADTGGLNGIEFLTLREEKVVLFAAPDHPLAKRKKGIHFHELDNQPVIMREEGSGTQKFVKEAFLRHKIRPNTLLETGNVDCIKDIIAKGEGISFLSEISLRQDLKEGRFKIIPILDENIKVNVQIAYLKDQPLSPAAKAFIDILMEGGKDQNTLNFLLLSPTR